MVMPGRVVGGWMHGKIKKERKTKRKQIFWLLDLLILQDHCMITAGSP
jgi:hypothetical protein